MRPGGYIYFIKPVGMLGPIKIGCSQEPAHRLSDLSLWSPFPLEIVATAAGDFTLERNVHRCFADCHSHKEWFHAVPRLLAAIESIKAGKTIAEAIDLSDQRGSLPQRKPGGGSWSPAVRRYMGLLHKIRFAVLRAEKKTGVPRLRAPEAIDKLPDLVRSGCALTPEDQASLDEFLADPSKFCRPFVLRVAA